MPKVSEAEVMAAGGVEDIFIAYPMVGEFRIHRALELQKRVKRLILAVDSLEGAAALSRSAGEAGLTCEVRLEVDHRCPAHRRNPQACSGAGGADCRPAAFEFDRHLHV